MSQIVKDGCQRRRMVFVKPVSRTLLVAAVAGVCVTAAAGARADTSDADILWINHPSIIVESNGHAYTEVKNSSHSIEGKIKVSLDAGVTGRVQSFESWPKLGVPIEGFPTSWDDFKDSGYSKSYSTPRPKTVEQEFGFSIPRQDYDDFMVVACNMNADRLRGQGKKDSEIFDENRIIEVSVDTGLYVDYSGPDNITPTPQEVSYPTTINVVCERDDSLDPVATPEIEGAYVQAKALPKNLRGGCELEINGSVISREPNTQVKFVYVDDKGNVSDLKTVTTSGEANTTFQHKFPVSAEHESGKVRIVGQSHPFYSNWASFESQCNAPADDFKTVLPPKAVAVQAYATADTVLYRGRLCPAKAKIWGVLEGRGEASGAAALFAGGQLKGLRQYQAEDGKTIIVEAEHALTWEGNQTGQQNVLYRMNVSNAAGDLIDHVEGTQNYECRAPQTAGVAQGAAGGIASNDNLPKSVTLSLSTQGQKTLPGWVCPQKVRLHGNVMSDDQPLSGTAILYVGDTFIQEHDVDLEANWGHNYDAEHEFSWNAATQTEQTLDFTLKFANQHGHVVKTVKKTESFACRKIATTGLAGAGGLTGGQQPGQASRPAAVGQLVSPQEMALSIQAPKGLVRQGQIRLTGGAANAKYGLSFLRKNGGGYTKVQSAQLPKQMTGLAASFPLQALNGGREWRLEVCPLGQAAAACRTSDFRLSRIGTGAGVKAPAQVQPKGTVILVPGAVK